MKSRFDYSENERNINKVIKQQKKELELLECNERSSDNLLDHSIKNSETLLHEIGYSLPLHREFHSSDYDETKLIIEDWEAILNRANLNISENIVLEDIFTEQEIHDNQEYMNQLYSDFYGLNQLDKWDYGIAGIAGTIAALLDFFIVTRVSLKTGDVLANKCKSGVEGLWNKILSPEQIKLLERKYKVPFDISTNTSRLSQEVLGLNPKTHRFQSLGHDPLLGFIFGIKDLMNGELTAIDGNGRLIIQSVKGADTRTFVESIIMEFGHLLSDVNATSKTGMKLSIPAPLMPLLQMIQVGSVEYNGKKYTTGSLVKKMYYDGYNFNQFIGMSVPSLIIEIIIRLYYVLRLLFEDNYIENHNKRDIMLFLSYSIFCTENVGKVVISKNPFAVNYVSWMSTTKYAAKAMKYVLIDYHIDKLSYTQKVIDAELDEVYEQINKTWNSFFGEENLVVE